MLGSYEGKDLNEVDKKLIRGLTEKKIVDTEESKDKILGGLRKFLLNKIQEEKDKKAMEEEERVSEVRDQS